MKFQRRMKKEHVNWQP